MFAIIQTGGKQYCIEKGSRIHVEKLNAETGSQVQIQDVLLIGNGAEAKIGQPMVSGVSVTAHVLRHLRGPKVIVFKKRSKKGYKKIQGHRQELTEIEIKEIQS